MFLLGDGMHLVHQNLPALCWGDPKESPLIRTNTGRSRLNILCAFNTDTRRFMHLTGEENCDANRIVEYFSAIISAYPTAPKIALFLDNAKYFKPKLFLNG